VFLAGGDDWTGSRTTNTGTDDSAPFPASNGLRAGPALHRPCWYATPTTLPDGRIHVQGGKGGADRPELRGPFACGTGHSAQPLYGRVGTSIRSLA
jgi:hypothetical protein